MIQIARRLKQTVIGSSDLRIKIETRINRGDAYPDIAMFCKEHGLEVTKRMVAHYARNVMGYRKPKAIPISKIERDALFERINKEGIPDSPFIRDCKAAYTALNERMRW